MPSDPHVLPGCIYCTHCNARRFHRESEGFCCSDGKVKLCMYGSPLQLYDLFTFEEVSCMKFKKILRGYNNHFAFISFGVKYDKELFKAFKCI